MSRIILRFLPLFFLLLSGMLPPGALYAEIPEVTVNVSESGSGASDAKMRGLARGEQTAFYRMLEKLTREKALLIAKKTPPQQVGAFISGFDILQERSMATLYQAKIRYRFNEALVKKLISDTEGLAPDVQGSSLLVLPLYDDGSGKVSLWEKENLWRTLFNAAALERGRDEIIMPFGDPKDTLILDSKNVFSTQKTTFVQMAERYGVKNIVIALAHPVAAEQGPASLEVILRRAGAGKEDDSHLKYTPEKGEDQQGMMRRAAGDIVDKLASSTETFSLDFNPEQKLKGQVVRVEFAYPGQWLKMRQGLENIPGVESSAIGAAAPGFTQMVFYYRGAKASLQQAIASRGFTVRDQETYWVVMLAGGK